MASRLKFGPYSTTERMRGKGEDWWPESERARLGSYDKYDQLYWNDPTQYALRVLEDEEPIYIPNSRVIVDTTAHYLMKGLKVRTKKDSGADFEFLTAFLKRERFFSRFKMAKKTGIARGDWAFHITADPEKVEGSRITLEPIHPGLVWKVEDEEEPGDFRIMHVFDLIEEEEDGEVKERVRVLTYEKVRPGKQSSMGEVNSSQTNQIYREENIYETDNDWWGEDRTLNRKVLEREMLDARITQFPIYWWKNIEWGDELYGASELRGVEFMAWAVSQGATDVSASVALDGLGVYATDGGRPVNDQGEEVPWEVTPGRVAEVPAGAYFRRVEGIGSITPAMEQINYLERKMHENTSLTDVAMGQVQVAEAESGIALAIKFLPTLAKLEDRDTAGVEVLEQMWYDLKAWFLVYEKYTFNDDIIVEIDKTKLPIDREAVLNELNNFMDRRIISRKFYRQVANDMLGYSIPDNMDEEIIEEAQKFQVLSPAPGTNPAEDGQAGNETKTSADRSNSGGNVDRPANSSNNRNRPNESSGTEAGQSTSRQTKS